MDRFIDYSDEGHSFDTDDKRIYYRWKIQQFIEEEGSVDGIYGFFEDEVWYNIVNEYIEDY